MVSINRGSEAAAANSGWGETEQAQILVVIVKPAGIARIAGEPNNVIACKNATSAPAR
jgi:hypothetical protein